MIRTNGEGEVILTRNTGVSIGLVILVLGGVFGFFGAWGWSDSQQSAYVLGHAAVHSTERDELLAAIKGVEIQQAETNMRLKALERQAP